MIKQKYYELFEKHYYNATPQRKAVLDMIGMFVGAVLGGSLVSLVAINGWWGELSFALLVYAFYGLLKATYQYKVSHYEALDKLKEYK